MKYFSSTSDKGDNDDNSTVSGQPRCFTLRSTRRQRPSMRNLQSTESISSDEEDDSFEILTAENLFSTLLSRVIYIYIYIFLIYENIYKCDILLHQFNIIILTI